MLFVQRHRGNSAPANKEKVMVEKTIDPPSDERKRSGFWRQVRGLGRKLVNRQTFILATRALTLMVRLVELVNRLRGDL
jgi:hypothetical protein